MKVKKKITKKKLKQPDEFISITEKSYLFISHHNKNIIIGTILVLVLILSFFLFRMWDQRKEDEANQKFILALEAYQMVSSPYREGSPAEYKKVLEGFEEGKKDYEKAVKAYQEIIKLGEKYHWAGVHLNMARCYEKLGKTDEALENYRTFLKISPKSLSTNSILKKISIFEK